MENKIEIKVPEGKESKQTTDANGNIIIQFVDNPKGKMLNDYIVECGFSSSYFDTHTRTITRDIPFEINKLTPYQAIQVLDAIARDLNGDWKYRSSDVCFRIAQKSSGGYVSQMGYVSLFTPFLKQEYSDKAIEICGTEFLDIIYRRFEK